MEIADLLEQFVNSQQSMTKSALKTAAARFLQHHKGDVEAAAQMLAKIQF